MKSYSSHILLTFFLTLLLLLLALVSYLYFQTDQFLDYEPTLEEDGICILRDVFHEQELEMLIEECAKDDYKEVKREIHKNPRLLKTLEMKCGSGYVFHDYILVIKKSSIHTCHRDSNGHVFNDIDHPSYTLIIYLEDMEKCLGVIPSSHKDIHSFGFNPTNVMRQVVCKKGDILLFNASIIHAGSLNLEHPDALRIQMKYSHKDDLPLLDYYTNYNKILKEENMWSFPIKKIQQNATCMAPILGNMSAEVIKNNKKIQNIEDISFVEKIFNYVFYGKSDYYHIPNAF
jgi:hypothetical protein